jgi:uncharacterized protein (TIRG00374 family)
MNRRDPGSAQSRPRLFSAAADQPRFRRATDAILLVPTLAGLVVLVVAYPPSRFERSLARFLQSFPAALNPIWGAFYDTLAVWALALIVLSIVARRHWVWVHALSSVVIAVAVALVSARTALGRWPDILEYVRLRADETAFPTLRIAVTASVILAIAPHLSRPLQSVGRWVLTLGVVGALLAENATPSASLAAVLVAVVAATVVRLSFGTSAGHPRTRDVLAALDELGVAVERLEPAARQAAGVFTARGTDVDGNSLLVKVYGRDAYDTQLLEKAWRTVLYRGDGLRVRLSRLEAVEHEALMTLLVAQAGIATHRVVVAAEASSGDALLVFRDGATPISSLGGQACDDTRLRRCWEALGLLASAGIAHNRIDPETVAVLDGEIGFIELDRSTIAPRPDQLLMDRAQLLATTAAVVGTERAVAAADRALGSEGVASLLPYLQPAAFGSTLHHALRGAGVDVDELRRQVAAAVGVDAPEPVKLRRITWWALVQIALLAFALSTIVGALAGLDYAALRDYFADASWGWIVFGFVMAQLPRLTQTIATLGAVPAKLPFVPVYAMQLATGYMNLALPSNLARMAVNIRFFQRQGVSPTTAVTAGAIDSFASTVVQALLLLLLILFSAGTLDLQLDTPSGPPVRALVILVALALAAVVALAFVPRVRNSVVKRVRRWWPEVRATVLAVRTGGKLTLLLGGSLATEVLFATALGVFARAFGYHVDLADLLLINISVSLLASLIPVPGGIGVTEFGLTVGLASAGIPEEIAFAIAITYRVATFYLPPLWGFFAMRWLRRTDRL